MKNKELKQEMLLNGKYNILKKFDKKLFKNYGISIKDYFQGETEEEKIKNMSKIIETITLEESININIKEIKAYIQISNNKKQKGCRLKNHLKYYVRKKYKLIFATFTFEENALKYKKEYRKKTITRELNKNNNIVDYIGNIDYGELNGREHYHYILILKKDFEPITKNSTIVSKKVRRFKEVTNIGINYKMGFCTYEMIGEKDNDIEKIKNYINKLTLHTMKQKERNQLITKRESPYHDYQKEIKRHKEELKQAKENRKKFKESKKIREIEKDYQMSIEQIKRLESD